MEGPALRKGRYDFLVGLMVSSVKVYSEENLEFFAESLPLFVSFFEEVVNLLLFEMAHFCIVHHFAGGVDFLIGAIPSRVSRDVRVFGPVWIILVFGQFHGQFPLGVSPVGFFCELHACPCDSRVAAFKCGDEIDPAVSWVFVRLEGRQAVWRVSGHFGSGEEPCGDAPDTTWGASITPPRLCL